MINLSRQTSLLTVTLALLSLPLTTSASGTYCVCITKPPTANTKLDRDKYDAGQKIFNEKTKLAPVSLPEATAAQHQATLKQLQALLPKRKAKKMDLTTWAGQLTNEQLDALAYYLQKRYGK